MKSKKHLCVAFTLLACLGVCATKAVETEASWFNARFRGDSTLHAYEGEANQAVAELVNTPDGQTRLRITVSVLGLDTGNNARDKRMFKMFEADTFALITGEADWPAVLDATQPAIPLTFTMHGVSQTVQAHRTTAADDLIALTCDLSITAFAMEPPSVMGMINVDDNVQVSVSMNRAALEQLNLAPANTGAIK